MQEPTRRSSSGIFGSWGVKDSIVVEESAYHEPVAVGGGGFLCGFGHQGTTTGSCGFAETLGLGSWWTQWFGDGGAGGTVAAEHKTV